MHGTPADKFKACENMPSMLLAAMCSQDQIGVDPLGILISASAKIKSMVASPTEQHTHTLGRLSDPLNAKEQQVLEASSSTQPMSEKYQAYKLVLKELILQSRNTTSMTNPISPNEQDTAEELQGESDEDFAKRLQESEFKGAGLK